MKTHVVKAGDCLRSIAERYGFARWQTIYEHGSNAELRDKRPDPNVLHPGDEVNIPDLDERNEAAATGKEHVFVKKALYRQIRIRVLDDARLPLASLPFTADDGAHVYSGSTDGDGWLELELPIASQRLEVDVMGWEQVFDLGHLNPLHEGTEDQGVSGAQARLLALGFDPGPVDGVVGSRTKAALVAFQRSYGLEPSGELDGATRGELEKRYGC